MPHSGPLSADFEFLLFCVNPDRVREAVAAGVDAVVVDWEQWGKRARQRSLDTQINEHTLEDLRAVRTASSAPVICRVNLGDTTAAEVENALGAGADEILLPMVTSARQVEAVLDQAAGRAEVGILIETPEAVRSARELAQLPLRRIYLGLNDLALARGTNNIFAAVADGTVERVADTVLAAGRRFGFAGLTLPDRGRPIPCRLLIGELIRLGASFSFLRRSFLADTEGLPMAAAVPAIREALATAAQRDAAAVAVDHTALRAAIGAWPGPADAVR
jgi:2-keto-3-deoxy-L-rhamnonate aldolase RhmA